VVRHLPKINISPSDVLVTFATSSAVKLQIAVVTEWLVLLHGELLTDQLATACGAGEAFAMVDFVPKLHPIIASDVLLADAATGSEFLLEAIVTVDLILAAHKLYASQWLLAFGALEAKGVPNVVLVGDDSLMANNLITTHSTVELPISRWLGFVRPSFAHFVWFVHSLWLRWFLRCTGRPFRSS